MPSSKQEGISRRNDTLKVSVSTNRRNRNRESRREEKEDFRENLYLNLSGHTYTSRITEKNTNSKMPPS